MSRILSPRNILIAIALIAVTVLSRVFFPAVLPTIVLEPEAIPGLHIGAFNITNTLIATLLADLTVIILGLLAVRNMQLVPGGLQNLTEAFFEGFYNFAQDIVGNNARRFFPLTMTFFLLILAGNWWERVPGFDSIGAIEKPHAAGIQTWKIGHLGSLMTLTTTPGPVYTAEDVARDKAAKASGAPVDHNLEYGVLVPFLRGQATDLNFTVAMALIAFFYIQYQGFRALGPGYLKKFFTLAGPVEFFVGILEFISEIAKIISFSFRLFGNIFAGTVLILVMTFLLPWLVPVPFNLLEVLIGFIQALVFAVLTLVFVAGAMESHEHGHDDHVATHAEEAAEEADQAIRHAAAH